MGKNLRHFTFTVLLSVFIFACGATAPTIETAIVGTQSAAAAQTIENALPTLAPPATATALPVITLAPPTLLPTAVVSTVTAAPTLPPTAALSGINGASCIPANSIQHGTVVDVVDGDTIKVLLDEDGKTYSLRYIGMDTPEMNSAEQQLAMQARNRNAELAYGKKVTLIKDVSETDRYNRLLRYVLADSIFVNYQLVAEGYARAVAYPPDTACNDALQSTQQTALAAGLGLWGATRLATVPVGLATEPGSGGSAPCSCKGPDLDCKDFGTHSKAQACYNYCNQQGYGDVYRLDGDHDGTVCESLP